MARRKRKTRSKKKQEKKYKKIAKAYLEVVQREDESEGRQRLLPPGQVGDVLPGLLGGPHAEHDALAERVEGVHQLQFRVTAQSDHLKQTNGKRFSKFVCFEVQHSGESIPNRRSPNVTTKMSFFSFEARTYCTGKAKLLCDNTK